MIVIRLALVAIASAAVGGFIAVPLVVLFAEGPAAFVEAPAAILGALFLGLLGGACAAIVATLPAMMPGWLLLRLRIRHRAVWAAVGAVSGMACYVLAGFFPGGIGETVRVMAGPDPVRLLPAFAIAGGIAALFFRRLAELFIDDDDEPAATEPA